MRAISCGIFCSSSSRFSTEATSRPSAKSVVSCSVEFEDDKRIVGIKNVSLNERYLSHASNGRPVLPPTILTEAVAQVGAILVLAKPENRQRLPFFAGIERVRYRHPVHPGDVVIIEANVVRLRSRMGVLRGVARVDGRSVIDGTMTFALGPATPSLP